MRYIQDNGHANLNQPDNEGLERKGRRKVESGGRVEEEKRVVVSSMGSTAEVKKVVLVRRNGNAAF